MKGICIGLKTQYILGDVGVTYGNSLEVCRQC